MATSMFATGQAPGPQVGESASSILASIKRGLALLVPKRDLALSLSSVDVQGYVDVLYENICISSDSTGVAVPFPPFDDTILPHARRLLRVLSNERGVIPSSVLIDSIELDRSSPELSGGFGRVQRGLYHGRYVAIKSLHPGHAENLKRSCREAVTWLMISHPHTLPLWGVCVSEDGTCMKMVSPWCSNGNIEQYLAGGHRKPERGRLLTEIVDAVEHLHSRNIVHGDLHPKNILIDDDGHVRVADFGLSDFTESSMPNSLSGGVVDYIAPEKHLSPSSHQKPSDMFSFGSICFFVYTLHAPFSGARRKGPFAAAFEIVTGVRPPRPTDAQCGGPGTSMSDGLWELVTQCWLHDPTARPSAMEISCVLRVLFGQQACVASNIRQ